jgi:hypothetical protein
MPNQEKNKWKDKLDSYPTQDNEEGWDQMQLLLDKHLPQNDKRKWRYTSIVLLLLILIIGICNYPQLKDNYLGDDSTERTNKPPVSKSEIKPNSTTATPNTDVDVNTPGVDKKKTSSNNSKIQKENKATGESHFRFRQDELSSKNNRIINSKKEANKKSNLSSLQKSATLTTRDRSIKQETKESEILDNTQTTELNRDQPASKQNITDNKDSLATAVLKDSSTPSTAIANKEVAKKQSTKRDTKFSLGAGLYYYLPINGQEKSSVNAKGKNSNLSDFAPAIMARFYITEKLFIQGELLLNAPQFTDEVLLSRKVTSSPVSPNPGGPTTTASRQVESKIFTNKFFYLDAPLSLHISPAKNIFIGAGLQYSYLKNSVGLYEEKILTTGRPDSLVSKQIKPIDDSLAAASFKKHDLRYNVSAMFKINRFDVGVRYSKSFQPYLYTPPTGTSPSRITNSALSFFIRTELVRIKGK